MLKRITDRRYRYWEISRTLFMDSIDGLEILLATYCSVFEIICLQSTSRSNRRFFDRESIWRQLHINFTKGERIKMNSKKRKGGKAKSPYLSLNTNAHWKNTFASFWKNFVVEQSKHITETINLNYASISLLSLRFQCRIAFDKGILENALGARYRDCSHKSFVLLFQRYIPTTNISRLNLNKLHAQCFTCRSPCFGNAIFCSICGPHIYCSEHCAHQSKHWGHPLKKIDCPHTFDVSREYIAGCFCCGFAAVLRVGAVDNRGQHDESNHHITARFICVKINSVLTRNLVTEEGQSEICRHLSARDFFFE